jgi:uncharacterized protein YbjT (DUF2867 family)/uncharacterized membrane protein YphA (DoxX/SURF4 family)
MPDVDALAAQLRNVTVVINTVGILRERGAQSFAALHSEGPRRLFDACAAAGVPRVIQISALGAAADAPSLYHRSKYAADFHLLDLPLDSVVVRPSLVYGAGGASAALFDRLAALPLIPLPLGGHQRVQPVHVDDLIAVLVRLVESPVAQRGSLPVVGPMPITLRQFVLALRESLQLGPARVVSIPRFPVALAAWLGGFLPNALLDRETFAMLERGNIADPAAMQAILGRAPRATDAFIVPARRDERRTAALLSWLAPLLRVSIAAVWIAAGVVSLGVWPVDRSLALLADIGVPTPLAPWLLYGSASLDFALGVLTLLPRRGRWLWNTQIALVLAYTAIISWRLPGLWLDPFGPVVKNLPILAVLVVLKHLDRRTSTKAP